MGGESSANQGQGIGGAIFAVNPDLAPQVGVATAPIVTSNNVTFANNTSTSSNPDAFGLLMAKSDVVNVKEAGGLNNSLSGTNPTGNVLANDTNVNNTSQGLTVIALRRSDVEGVGEEEQLGVPITTNYGQLTLNSDGTYSYILDNENIVVQALNMGETLTESFNYVIASTGNSQTDTATLVLTIEGSNDSPTLAAIDPVTLIDTSANDVFSDISGNLVASDLDGGTIPLAYGVLGGVVSNGISTVNGTYGSLSVNTTTGAYNYTPNATAINAIKNDTTDNYAFTIANENSILLSDNFFAPGNPDTLNLNHNLVVCQV